MKLPEYLNRYSRSECIELNTQINNGDGSMKNTVVNLLQRHKADKHLVGLWLSKGNYEMTKKFEHLMSEVK